MTLESKEKENKQVDNIFAELGVSTIEEDNIYTILKHLLNTDNIEVKTALTINEITIYNKALWYAETYKTPSLYRYINRQMILKISQDRKGREEIVKAIANELERQRRHELAVAKGKGIEV